jgi:hypothetical protein
MRRCAALAARESGAKVIMLEAARSTIAERQPFPPRARCALCSTVGRPAQLFDITDDDARPAITALTPKTVAFDDMAASPITAPIPTSRNPCQAQFRSDGVMRKKGVKF